MLASIFIIQGYDTFRRPERVAAKAEPVVRPVAERVPMVPAKAEQAVRLNGAVQMIAGSLLALGRWPRLSALAIAGTLVPTTLAGHRFWEAEDDASKAQQRIHFLKNLSMFGGLLIAAADTGGKPSIAWRVRHAAKSARGTTGPARGAARGAAKSARGTARDTAKSARGTARGAVESARGTARGAAKSARGTARGAAKSARGTARGTVESARKEAARVVESARKEAARVVESARKDAARVVESARKDAARVARTAKTSGKAGVRTARASGKAGTRAGRLASRVSR
jgi:uncharacterized membrane protein YphA (DoxX/SURF4 family)